MPWENNVTCQIQETVCSVRVQQGYQGLDLQTKIRSIV